MKTGSGPEHLEHFFKHRVVQDGDPRDIKNLPTGRGVGHIHRFQRRILPHTNSQSVQEVHALSPPGSVLPVQSPTLWPIHSFHGVHSGGQRGQTHGTLEGYKDQPVPRRLAGESLYPRHLSPAYSNPGHTVPGTRVAGEQGKVRTGPQTGLQLRRLPVRPERGQGQTNRRMLADLDRQDQINTVGSGLPGLTIHVPHRSTNSNRKASPLRATTHDTHTVALEKQLEGPRITGKGDLRWWLEESNVLLGQPLHPLKHALQIFTDASKEGWGAHLDEHTARGTWSLPESKLHINHLELKAVFLALKEFRTPGTNPKWTCLPPGLATNYHSLSHWSQTPRLGQWLQEGTIDGYKSAIAYKLGNSTINVSKDEISLVPWIVSIETDPRAGGVSPPGTFPWCYTS